MIRTFIAVSLLAAAGMVSAQEEIARWDFTKGKIDSVDGKFKTRLRGNTKIAGEEGKQYLKEVFIHAKTYFDDNEWNGFEEAAHNKCKLIGVRIRNDGTFKLYRHKQYCVPRGMMFQYDENKAYLWTKGFIPRLKTQMGLETPNPIDIQITRGNADIEIVCRDILSLTKLNYNACIYGDGLPVTLKFAESIGEILTAGRDIKAGVLQFKYYI